MNNNHRAGPGALRARGAGVRSGCIALALGAAGAVQAFEFDSESYTGSLDTTVSYGIASRLEGRDANLIGIPNGGTAFSVNGDDGNLNFDKGIFSNVLKLTSELEMNFEESGIFARASAFYDFEIEDGNRDHVPLTDDAKKLVGSDIELLDAYYWRNFEIGERAGDVRLGNQVLSWGESTFIQNSINTINPIDVAAIRVPGAELREALQPVPILSGSLETSENTSLEAFYQLTWKETTIDPPGAYFSSNDFVGEGGSRVQLGFGGVGEGDFLGVGRAPTGEPKDDGQFGLAFRVFAPSLNDTEFGFYYINYHSRVPLISANTSQAGVDAANAVYNQTGLMFGDDPNVDTIALDAYARHATYLTEYPEDIQLLGVSFNTQLGTSGVALQGEISHRQDTPLQVDDVEVLFAAISPINPAFAAAGQLGAFGPDERVTGYILRDLTQVQVTATKAFAQVLGAEQLAVVGEVGLTHVNDFPDKDTLRLESSGTYISGNAALAAAHGPAAGQYERASRFADEDSWGYRLLARLTYNNAIGSANLTPRIAYSEDVNGNSPGPGGNFLEGRQALTLGLGVDYLSQWSGDISYTQFDGAGRYNLINDRDFIAANVKFSF